MPRHVAFYEGVLGTSLELQLVGAPDACRRAEVAALAEIDRLEAIFSRYRADSELARWESDSSQPISEELREVLAMAERYRQLSQGAFDPTLTHHLGPLWTIEGEHARRHTPHPANLNSLAKGYIVDRAAQAAYQDCIEELLLNIGGDLRHLGKQFVAVNVADPFAPGENAKPVARIRLRNQGMATSGNYRRGRHLVDPRTGNAADHIAGATVVASTTAEADAFATIFFVLSPPESLRLADDCGVALFLALPNRKSHANAAWRRLRTR